MDNKNFDLYEERLIEDGINQVDRKKKELLAYVNHLNEIADSNKYQYQIKKGGKVKFPEPSFTVLTKETKRLIKKKFLAYATEKLESEPTISFAIVNVDYDR